MDARIGWRTNSSGVNWVIDMNTSEWKTFVGLIPNAELTNCSAIAYSPGFAYSQSDRASMPSHYPVMGSGAITLRNENQQGARISLAVFHDRKDKHWNLWAWGWTSDKSPVFTKEIEGHKLDDTKEVEIVVRVGEKEKRVTIKPEGRHLPPPVSRGLSDYYPEILS